MHSNVCPFVGFKEMVFLRTSGEIDIFTIRDWLAENCNGPYGISNDPFRIYFEANVHIETPYGGEYSINTARSPDMYLFLFEDPEDKVKFLLTFTEEEN